METISIIVSFDWSDEGGCFLLGFFIPRLLSFFSSCLDGVGVGKKMRCYNFEQLHKQH